MILQESALDYRLDPQLQVHCTDEVHTQTHTHTPVSYFSLHHPPLLYNFHFPLLSSVLLQISRLCAEEAAAQEQTGQVEECLKVNLLKIKQEACKKVRTSSSSQPFTHKSVDFSR